MTLLKASHSDIKTRQVPDYLSVMIAIAALIGTTPSLIPHMAGHALAVSAPLIAAALLAPGKLGGADIKIMTAAGFLLGFEKGIAALVIGLALSLICTFVIRKAKKERMTGTIPLIPYLSAGCVITLFL